MPSRRYIQKARWDADRARRDAEQPAIEAEMAMRDVLAEDARKPGDYMGTLEWRDRSGKVRRWVVRRAERVNQIAIDGVSGPRSWSWLCDRLRRHLS